MNQTPMNRDRALQCAIDALTECYDNDADDIILALHSMLDTDDDPHYIRAALIDDLRRCDLTLTDSTIDDLLDFFADDATDDD